MKRDRISEKIRELRGDLMKLAEDSIPIVREAIEGKRRLSHQQTMLVKLVWGKVIPDVSSLSVEQPEKLDEKEMLSREQLEQLVLLERSTLGPIPDRFKSDEELADSLEDIEVVRQRTVSINELPVPFMKLEAARRERAVREGGGASVGPGDDLAESDP